MPPAQRKPRARTYDPAKVRAALVAQVRALQHAVDPLCAASDAGLLLDGPTRLGDWTVRELIVHIAACLDTLPRLLAERPAPAKAELDLQGYLRALRGQAEEIAGGLAAEMAALPGSAGPKAVRDRLDAAADRFCAAVAEADGATPLATRFGAMSVDDFLVTRLLETVVHGDDLTAATGAAIAHDRQALATVTRLTADALAAKTPGGSVEVRIPPFAVVQCVEGPKHTRGTPPNVVETDPWTWIRLATGRVEWTDAVDAALVSASGERADLSGQLPVLG
ncbi:sterol carrier family protein [Streptomyces sp. H27-D2]|uniref:sterol carrier family protein n=1 Tax=Streptomyces sp. H27-D2 TaxID=3046304 RepID=UPI002DBC821B|nr:sterol carrier family protein [Streptomyces sp. H27-D2]MEC4016466.1 sterol carrier family protein [Streptomyces sp. H27-D2]